MSVVRVVNKSEVLPRTTIFRLDFNSFFFILYLIIYSDEVDEKFLIEFWANDIGRSLNSKKRFHKITFKWFKDLFGSC